MSMRGLTSVNASDRNRIVPFRVDASGGEREHSADLSKSLAASGQRPPLSHLWRSIVDNILTLHMLGAGLDELSACGNSNISCDSGASCQSDISCDSNQSTKEAV